MQQKHFVENYQFWLKLTSSLAVFAAGCMILVKVYAWYQTDSAVMLASLTDSMFDIAASIINFFVIRYALTPADEEHRFGHGKAEALAGLAQATFIMGSAMLLAFHSIERLKNPLPLIRPELAIYASVFSIVITLALVWVQRIAIKHTQSVAIKADSLHYQSDLLMNMAVVLALYLSTLGFYAMDGAFAIGIALYLVWGAKSIFVEAGAALMDKELPELTEQIEAIAKRQPLVYGVHAIRTRQAGATKFIQMHLELNDNMTLLDAHRVTHDVELAIEAEIPGADVLIHQDPISVVKKS
ncbi:cation diffusion facilitator family transporter [Alteromonadaceae bacterium BrNp21-10]|nr:cation diffusion facilitator family transporter [Alteromonadaceae bacterium BrNp21-10]